MGTADDDEQLGKLYEDLVAELAQGEYTPSPLVSFEEFRKKKKAILEKTSDELTDNALNGIVFFGAADIKNKSTLGLLERFLNPDLAPILQGGGLKAVVGRLGGQNMFGMTDEEYERLLALADKTNDKGLTLQASMMFQALVFMFPARLEAWLRWGQVECEHFFDYRKDVDIYERCLECFPHPAVYASLGICHVKGGDYPQAEVAFTKAIERCEEYEAEDLKKKTQGMLTQLKALMGT